MNRLIAVVSLVILVATLFINYKAGTGQVNGIATGEVSGMYPTLFTPAGFTFSIWSVIYLLNITFIIMNLVLALRKPDAFQKPLVFLFIIICLVNTAWIFAWHFDLIPASVILMLSLLFFLILAFRLSHNTTEQSWAQELAKVNFAVYLGWISVATIANVSVLIAGPGNTHWTQPDVTWTWAVIAVAVVLGAWMVLRFRSYAYAFVIAWAFYGIYSARSGQLTDAAFQVAEAALIGVVVVLVTSGYAFTRKLIRLRS